MVDSFGGFNVDRGEDYLLENISKVLWMSGGVRGNRLEVIDVRKMDLQRVSKKRKRDSAAVDVR